MAAQIITVSQQKGGAGKTTLAAQLGITLSLLGKRVALVDIDPQQSLTAWFNIRKDLLKNPLADLTTVPAWRISSEFTKLKSRYDHIVIDSPPHAETEARAAIRAADIVLVPMQPSPMDLWATQPTLDLAAREKSLAAIVLNRVPPRAKIVAKIKDDLARRDLLCLSTTVGNRTDFATSMMDGKTAVETRPSSTASEEMRSLAIEIAGLQKPK